MKASDLDRHITGNYGEDQLANKKHGGREDAPEGCAYGTCLQDALPNQAYCEYHNNPFVRIEARNRALWRLLDTHLTDADRKAALDECFGP